MKRNLIILTALTLAVLFLTSSLVPAFAADGKSYPGSMAVPWGSCSNVPYGILYSSFGNDSTTTTLKVDLPLINDGYQYIYSGKVKVVDMNPYQNFSIYLCAAKPYVNGGSASICKSTTTPYPTSYSSNSTLTLEFPYIDYRVSGYGLGSNIYYSCHIPTKYGSSMSKVFSYYVNEMD